MIAFIELNIKKSSKEKKENSFKKEPKKSWNQRNLNPVLSGLTPEKRQIYPGQLPYTRRMRFPFQDFSCN